MRRTAPFEKCFPQWNKDCKQVHTRNANKWTLLNYSKWICEDAASCATRILSLRGLHSAPLANTPRLADTRTPPFCKQWGCSQNTQTRRYAIADTQQYFVNISRLQISRPNLKLIDEIKLNKMSQLQILENRYSVINLSRSFLYLMNQLITRLSI
jgi:hypothetical protein